MTEVNIDDYKQLAVKTLEDIKQLYQELNERILDYAEAEVKVEQTKSIIEQKKSSMIVNGEISGKNAEERAANTWVAIPEYDELVLREQAARFTRASLEVAKNKLSSAKRQHEFYLRMIDLAIYGAPSFTDLEEGQYE